MRTRSPTNAAGQFRPLHLVLCALVVGGCSFHAVNIERGQQVLQPNTALLVGSVSQTSDGKPSPFHERAMFYFSDTAGGTRFRLDSAQIERPLLGPPNHAMADRGLEDVNGKLFAVQLPAGSYQLHFFQIEGTQQKIELERPLRFELSAGEVAYIGNLDAAFCIRHAYANQAGVAGVVVSVRDRADRDFRLLGERFASLRQKPVAHRVLDNSLLQPQVARLARQCRCWKNC